jgi:hypothetical protein
MILVDKTWDVVVPSKSRHLRKLNTRFARVFRAGIVCDVSRSRQQPSGPGVKLPKQTYQKIRILPVSTAAVLARSDAPRKAFFCFFVRTRPALSGAEPAAQSALVPPNAPASIAVERQDLLV